MSIVVLGASSGLGAALVMEYSSRGYDVIGVARRADKLEEVASIASSWATSGRIDWLAGDLSDSDFASRLSEIVDGSAQIVFFCAAAVYSTDGLPGVFEANLFWCARMADLIDRNDRKLVFLSSIASRIYFDGLGDYCASKAALEMWVRANRHRLRSRALLIRPGKFDSDLFGPGTDGYGGPLPMEAARAVIASVDRGQSEVTLGGVRDRLAFAFQPVVGSRLAKRVLK